MEVKVCQIECLKRIEFSLNLVTNGTDSILMLTVHGMKCEPNTWWEIERQRIRDVKTGRSYFYRLRGKMGFSNILQLDMIDFGIDGPATCGTWQATTKGKTVDERFTNYCNLIQEMFEAAGLIRVKSNKDAEGDFTIVSKE